MKEINNWFEFAREDFRLVKIALKEKIYNQVCFHSQQAAEKTLKGFLKNKSKNVPKTHFLDELLNLCIKIDNDFQALKEGCSILDDYYIPTRYPDALPGIFPEGLPQQKDAQEALSILKKIMEFVNKKLKDK